MIYDMSTPVLVCSQDPWSRSLPTLSDKELHIWRFGLKQTERSMVGFALSLSEEERLKASSFYLYEDRRRYVASRGMLRNIICKYLDSEPSSIEFSLDSCGRPFLKGTMHRDEGLQFSLSHSHDLAVCAVVKNRSLGVDLEYVRDTPCIEQVADAFFSRQETAILRKTSNNERLRTFYRIWTQREAYAKAAGAGLDTPAETDSSWSVFNIEPAPNYVGALAVKGYCPSIRSLSVRQTQC